MKRSRKDICKVICFNEKKVNEIKSSLPSNEEINEMAEMINNFADPTRIKIILALAGNELCVCDISNIIGLSISATSHQLRKLRDKKILKYRNDGKMVYYSLNNNNFPKFLRNITKLILEKQKRKD